MKKNFFKSFSGKKIYAAGHSEIFTETNQNNRVSDIFLKRGSFYQLK